MSTRTYTVKTGSVPATLSVAGIAVPTDMVSFVIAKKQSNSLTYFWNGNSRKPCRNLGDDGGVLKIAGLVSIGDRENLKGLVYTGPFTVSTLGITFNYVETKEFNMKKNDNQTIFYTGTFSYVYTS